MTPFRSFCSRAWECCRASNLPRCVRATGCAQSDRLTPSVRHDVKHASSLTRGDRGSRRPRSPEEINLKGQQMNQTTTAPAKLKTRPTNRPPARKPRSKHALIPSMLAEYQGGRVRAWLYRNAWLVVIAVAWVFAFVMEFAPEFIDPKVSAVCAAMLFGFGIGWIIRDEAKCGE